MTQNRYRRKFYLVGIVAFIFFIIVLLTYGVKRKILFPKSEAIYTPPRPSSQSSDPTPLDNKARDRAPLNKATNETNQIDKLVKDFNVPIIFWGKVVDQNQRPLVGVKVSYSVRLMTISPAKFPEYRSDFYETFTDNEGFFSITDKQGDSLNIEKLDMKGYQLSSRAERSFAYAQSPVIFKPYSQYPIEFLMVNIQNKPLKFKRFNVRMRMPFDETPVAINPTTGGRAANAPLKFSCLRELKSGAASKEGFAWKCNLILEGGGLLEMQPSAIYEAPDKGYESQRTFEMKADDSKWSDTLRRELYFKTAENLYGRLIVEIVMREDEPDAFVSVSGFLNLHGLRDLDLGSSYHIIDR